MHEHVSKLKQPTNKAQRLHKARVTGLPKNKSHGRHVEGTLVSGVGRKLSEYL